MVAVNQISLLFTAFCLLLGVGLGLWALRTLP